MAAVAAGGAHPAVARRGGVAVATVGTDLRLQRTTGGLPPRPRPGGRAASGPEGYPARQAQLRAAPDAPLAQHCVTWAETQGQISSSSTMGRTLTRSGWPWEKTLGATERDAAARAAWRAEVTTWAVQDGVVLAELGANVGLTPTQARAPRNEPAYAQAPANHGANHTTLAVLTPAGLVVALTVRGAADALTVAAFLRTLVVPLLRPVLDNVATHKGAGVRRLVEAAGGQLRCLPAYSPDLSPIEAAFAKRKALLRRAKARTAAALDAALGSAREAITPRAACHYFAHCGYGTAT